MPGPLDAVPALHRPPPLFARPGVRPPRHDRRQRARARAHRRSGEPRSAIRTEYDGGGGFEARHKQFWEKCSKYDPRVHPFAFDENDPGVREVRAAQRSACWSGLAPTSPSARSLLASGDGAPCTRRRTLELELDVGTFAAGIGPVDNITVVTTREQNQNDGMADPDAMTRWRLVCCLAPDGSKIVATHKPTQHAGGNLKKPRPTATVERLAEQAVLELAKTEGLPFKSSSLPDYTRAWFFERGGSDRAAAAAAEGEEPGVWVLQRRGERRSDLNPQDSLCWSFDEEVPNTLAIDLLKIPQPAGWPHTTGEVFHSQACAARRGDLPRSAAGHRQQGPASGREPRGAAHRAAAPSTRRLPSPEVRRQFACRRPRCRAAWAATRPTAPSATGASRARCCSSAGSCRPRCAPTAA